METVSLIMLVRRVVNGVFLDRSRASSLGLVCPFQVTCCTSIAHEIHVFKRFQRGEELLLPSIAHTILHFSGLEWCED